MGNLLCVLAHCSGRGEEIIAGDKSHIFLLEQGNIAQVRESMFDSLERHKKTYHRLRDVRFFTQPGTSIFGSVSQRIRYRVCKREKKATIGLLPFQFAGVQCRTLRNCPDGTFSTDDLVSAIRPDDMVCEFFIQ